MFGKILTLYFKFLCIVFSTDCSHFDVEHQGFPLVEELEEDIKSYESMWSLYEEFSAEIESMSQRDWISFRYYVLICFCLCILRNLWQTIYWFRIILFPYFENHWGKFFNQGSNFIFLMLTSMFNLQDKAITVTSNFYIRKKFFFKKWEQKCFQNLHSLSEQSSNFTNIKPKWEYKVYYHRFCLKLNLNLFMHSSHKDMQGYTI